MFSRAAHAHGTLGYTLARPPISKTRFLSSLSLYLVHELYLRYGSLPRPYCTGMVTLAIVARRGVARAFYHFHRLSTCCDTNNFSYEVNSFSIVGKTLAAWLACYSVSVPKKISYHGNLLSRVEPIVHSFPRTISNLIDCATSHSSQPRSKRRKTRGKSKLEELISAQFPISVVPRR